MNGKIYINIDFKEYEYFLPRVISCTSYFSHFSPPTFFPLLSQFYSRCFLSPSSATAFRAYLRATHLLEFLSGNFTGTSRLPRSLLFYPSFSLKKKKRKKKGEGFSEKNFSLANLIVYRYRTNTNTDKIYPIRKIYNFKNIRTIKKLIK